MRAKSALPLNPEQLPRTPNDGPAIWDLVAEDMDARDQLGRVRYGMPVQPNNGRDALRDAYTEALDLASTCARRSTSGMANDHGYRGAPQ